ncbi:MAG: amidohydrolase family protein [Chitinophagaceae bacterium]|nr:amidohydrolase family protein [Chitinophagaceae bacterium]
MQQSKLNSSRRNFLTQAGILAAGSVLPVELLAENTEEKKEPIIDIHQHIHYMGRTDDHLIAHQKAIGATTTILLPAGRPVNSDATHQGLGNGLQAQVGGNAETYLFAMAHRKHFKFGACAVPDAPDAIYDIEKYLKLGAKVIGELKFGVECDSPEMHKIYQLAQAYDVPVLMHWQKDRYFYGLDRFYKILEQYPRVNFIGHAQFWWANVDKGIPQDLPMYPKGIVTPGGLTERYLTDYPNMYGDLSAGSGLNAFKRDEGHGSAFMQKLQDKLLFGSDCWDNDGIVDAKGECTGTPMIATIRALSGSKAAERKILYENAKKLFKL